MQDKVYKKRIKDIDKLYARILTAWEKMDQRIIDKAARYSVAFSPRPTWTNVRSRCRLVWLVRWVYRTRSRGPEPQGQGENFWLSIRR